MPVLSAMLERMAPGLPLKGARIASCLQLTKETGVLLAGAQRLGARVTASSGNPLTTQDDVASYLRKLGMCVHGRSGQSRAEFEGCLMRAARSGPTIVADGGGQLLRLVGRGPMGGTEETRTGAVRARAAHRSGSLPYPVVVVDEARTKRLFDSRLGTGQSALDGLLRAAGLSMSGRAAVAGYGMVGRGVARRCRAMGSQVTVTETDPRAALEAAMDGFRVEPMGRAARSARRIVTCTGMKGVVSGAHLGRLRRGAVLANAGHFDVEIDAGRMLQGRTRSPRRHLDECRCGGSAAYLVSKGRVANLSAAEGHPPEIMDLSFAGQLLSMVYIHRSAGGLPLGVSPMPSELDEQVARACLAALGTARAGAGRRAGRQAGRFSAPAHPGARRRFIKAAPGGRAVGGHGDIRL